MLKDPEINEDSDGEEVKDETPDLVLQDIHLQKHLQNPRAWSREDNFAQSVIRI